LSRVVGVLVVVVGSLAAGGALLSGPAPASAAVERGQGFSAIVDGYRSWFGSYRLGDLGEVWCVDHGIAAPDVALAYEPTTLEDRAPETRRAVAWAVGRFGVGEDRVGAAALMLAIHDLMGAVYPSGPLSVEALTVADLRGFEGREGDVLARARAIRADAAGRAGLVGPLAMTVAVDDERVAGRTGVLRAAVTDAAGAGVGDVAVHPDVTGAALLGDVDVVTGGADGAVSWSYEVGPGANRFSLSASVPGAELMALRPTRGAAQRVARPSGLVVQGEVSFEGITPRRFTIAKRGDAEPVLGVAGARFVVSGLDGELVVGPDGTTPPVWLLPGHYTVTEVAPPRGYDAAGPWDVVVADADVVLDVADPARRGGLDVVKLDSVTGLPVAGARFEVRGDVDGNASDFELAVPDWSAPLLEGRYSVREVAAPPHYRLASEPVVVEVRAGERAVATVADVPLATIGFDKHPALGGATFAVATGDGGDTEAGRCTTGADGRCSFPLDALEAGRSYCWTEVEAPPGWGRAEGGCVTLGAAGSETTFTVDEPELHPAPAPPPPVADHAVVPVAEEVAAPQPAPLAAPTPAPTPVERPTEVLSAPPELPRTGADAFIEHFWSPKALMKQDPTTTSAHQGRRQRPCL
jgi:hypothetical protein